MAARRIEGSFNQGWGIALFIIVLALGAYFTAFAINRRTNRSPNDVMAPAAGTVSH